MNHKERLVDFASIAILAEDSGTRDLLTALGGLVVALRRFFLQIESMRKYYPDQLSNLTSMSFVKDFVLQVGETTIPPKRKYEWNRRKGRSRRTKGDIEEQFGPREASDIASPPTLLLNPYLGPLGHQVPEPSCLDEVFTGGLVRMRKLEDLFLKDRHDFPRALSKIREGRCIFYDYRSVVKIMDSLLQIPEVRARPRRIKHGRRRSVWLRSPETRATVLSGIAKRLTTVSAPPEIKRAFRDLIVKYKTDSGAKKKSR